MEKLLCRSTDCLSFKLNKQTPIYRHKSVKICTVFKNNVLYKKYADTYEKLL